MFRINDFDVVIQADVTGSHRARALLVQGQGRLGAGVHPDRETLEVEQDVDHILLHPFDTGVLVQHTFNFSLNDGATAHG